MIRWALQSEPEGAPPGEDHTLESLLEFNTTLNGYVWGWPMMVLLIGTGLVLTVTTRGVQFR